MSITLAQIRTQAKYRADMVQGSFVTDAEWLTYINGSIAELHDLLIATYEDYYISTTTFSTAAGTAKYALPSDFYKLKGLDAQFDSGVWENVHKFSFENRNSQQNSLTNNLYYRILGTDIVLSPTPTSGISFKTWYVPVAIKLSSDSDEVADLNQFAEYIIVDAAIKALLKEESDPSGLMMQKEAIRQRIIGMAATRDENESEAITDVSNISWE